MITKVLNNQLLTENGNVYIELSKKRGSPSQPSHSLPVFSVSKRLTLLLEPTAIAHALIVSRREKELKRRKGGPARRVTLPTVRY